MARIRTVKPTLFHHEGLASCSPHARLLFIAMFQLADRSGRFRWLPMQVHAHSFPHEPGLDVAALAEELRQVGCVRLYSSDGRKFVDIPNFSKHQKVPASERKSAHPSVNEKTLTTFVGHDDQQNRYWKDGSMEVVLSTSALSEEVDVPTDLAVSKIWNTYKKYHPRSRSKVPKSWKEIVLKALEEFSVEELCVVVRWAKESRDYSFQRSKNIDKLNNILAETKLPGRIEAALEWAGMSSSLESYLEKNAQAALRYKDEFEAFGKEMAPGSLIHHMQEYSLPVPSPDVEMKVIQWLKNRKG